MTNLSQRQAPKVLLSEEQIQNRVGILARELDQEYLGKDVVAVCVLKGSVIFFTDIIRKMQTPVRCEFLGLASYHGERKSSGEVKITHDVKFPLENKHVIVFEDIIDSGLTLKYLMGLLQTREPASLKVCSLLFKPKSLKVEVKPDYVGFEIGNEFVVGYGLDFDGLYRDLPYVGVL